MQIVLCNILPEKIIFIYRTLINERQYEKMIAARAHTFKHPFFFFSPSLMPQDPPPKPRNKASSSDVYGRTFELPNREILRIETLWNAVSYMTLPTSQLLP